LESLSLSRKDPTLSGGESQRIRLASKVGPEFAGVLSILEEPSIGLHQRDNMHLLEILCHLRDIGNTLIEIDKNSRKVTLGTFLP
jgi:excinuclease ABC subunit A